jgi:hypothetical protein
MQKNTREGGARAAAAATHAPHTHNTVFLPLTLSASACSAGVDSAFNASMARRSGWSDPASGSASQNAQGKSSLAKEEGPPPPPGAEVEGRP